MSGIDRLIRAAWIDDAALARQFVRFFVGMHPVGWLTPAFAAILREWPDVFAHEADCVRLIAAIDDPARCTSAVATVIEMLAERDVIGGWRDELYPVRADGNDRPLLRLERAAARAFGIRSDAVHVNGIAIRAGHPSLWIARRAMTKSIDPGMRDNMIGGGVPAGLSIEETLVKEAWEEAGLDATIASTATAGRRLRIRRIVPEGLQSESIFVHDLVLPPSVVPRNQDGEVSGFDLVDVDAVLSMLDDDPARAGADPMTVDASLVTIDWLERQRLIALPESDACRAIYGPLP